MTQMQMTSPATRPAHPWELDLATGLSTPADQAVRPTLPYHVVHRPDTLEGLMNGSTAAVPQAFGISVLLPENHSLYNDGSGRCHDLHVPVEALRLGALFVAHRYFRVPVERPIVFAATELTATAPDAWLRTGVTGSGHLELDMVLRPADVVGGIPRRLKSTAELRIDGVDCGRATALLVFLMPNVYQNHRQRGRLLSRADAYTGTPVLERADRPHPSAVGRSDPANIVIGHCEMVDDELTVQVLAEAGHPLYADGTPDHVPAVVLLEATRQTAVLHAGLLDGFAAADCLLVGWSASFRGFAEPDLPLRCVSGAGPAERDITGRPTREYTLTFTQGARQIGVVRTSVLQLC